MLVRKSSFLILAFFLLIVEEFLMKFSALSLYSMIDELVVLLLFPYFILGVLKSYNRDKMLFLFFLFFLIYILTAVFSTINYGFEFKRVVLQLLLSSKFIFIFFALYYFFNFNFKKLKGIYTFIFVLSVFLVAYQLLWSDSYNNLFENGAHLGKVIFPSGEAVMRTAGPFWFTGTFATFLGGYLFYLIYSSEKIKVFSLVQIIVVFFLLVSTFSRQEIFSFVFVLLIVYLIYNNRFSNFLKLALVNVVLFIILLTVVVNFELIVGALFQGLLLSDIEYIEVPRIVMYRDSFKLAILNFPFGTGIGTFASASSVTFGSNVYQYLNFDSYLWYLEGKFLTDTYWPMVIGESGFIGLLFHFLSLSSFLMWFYMKKRTNKYFSKLGFAITLYLIVNSITSPVLSSVLIILFLYGFLLLQPSSSDLFSVDMEFNRFYRLVRRRDYKGLAISNKND